MTIYHHLHEDDLDVFSNGKGEYPWESTLNLYHHLPTIYIYICEKRAYGGIFREQTATGLNSQKCGPHILPLPGLGRILAG